MIEKIIAGEAKLFGTVSPQLNDSLAKSVFDSYMNYADSYSQDSMSAEYLFKAADLSLGMKNPEKSIELLQRITVEYPEHFKTPMAAFMIGFVYETGLNDKEKAKVHYKQFVEKYPDDKLAGAAQASYEQIESGLSDEELIQMFERQQDTTVSGAM